MEDKKTLRAAARMARDNSDSIYRQHANSRIFDKLTQTPEVIIADTIAIWVSYQSEADTHRLISYWLSVHKRIVVPKVINNDIQFFPIVNLNEVITGYKGVPEPIVHTSAIRADQINVCIVPGLAFDIQGYRLGYGKGFYDRFLATYPNLSIGICFTNQLLYEIPHYTTDIPVKRIITDTVSIPYTSSTASHL